MIKILQAKINFSTLIKIFAGQRCLRDILACGKKQSNYGPAGHRTRSAKIATAADRQSTYSTQSTQSTWIGGHVCSYKTGGSRRGDLNRLGTMINISSSDLKRCAKSNGKMNKVSHPIFLFIFPLCYLRFFFLFPRVVFYIKYYTLLTQYWYGVLFSLIYSC